MRFLLFPFVPVYHLVLLIRHWLFNIGLLRSESFNVPVIGLGNLSFGGTGKTPHVEYLVRLMQKQYHLAVLSRGYKRSTKGFLMSTTESGVKDIGDEPRQLKHKFPNLMVAVDEKRSRGIHLLLQQSPSPDVVLLDDAFQHRRVKPGLEILLTDYHHLYSKDYLFPIGRLRDIKLAARRASVIVVTKTPHVFSPFIKVDLLESLKPKPNQKVFFSFLKYGNFVPLGKKNQVAIPRSVGTILLVTGIADAEPLKDYLKNKCVDLIHHSYSDHYQFGEKDILHIVNSFDHIIGKNKIILTTEKDAGRLEESPYFRHLKNLPVFYLPVEVRFHQTEEESFDEFIINYVKSNKRHT